MRESLGRAGTPEEIRLLTELHRGQLDLFNTHPDQAAAFLKVGDLIPPADIPPAELAAATVLGSLPLLALVLLFQRQIVSGLTQGAVKG